MPLPESTISIVCNAIYEFVRDGVGAVANTITVTMGAPGKVAGEDDEHRINLFFYRFEPGGFESAGHPNDPWRIRLYCLISVFGISDLDATAGENDLRMLGEVIRIFHEKPVLDMVTVGSEQVRLQAVFSPITDEQINQVWSTQGEAIYRPSVIYQMALAPIIPSTLRMAPNLVGVVGGQARASQAARHSSFSGAMQGLPVGVTEIDIDDPYWAPAMCWIHDNDCVHSLSFNVAELFALEIWLAGDPSDTVDLVWEVWDSNSGWNSAGPSILATPFNTLLDPENIPTAEPGFPLSVTNPVVVPVGASSAQGLLYAMREVVIEGRSTVKVRSNPILLSLYRP